ncbi:APC family permease [Sulfurimonas autotrophica]|uniref:Amino acid permease-associated region n=1 Tax=Sulfurimonas autotrophica (strain ATCC BAA-671 / DSM 16294 / JCM 11897 / OK10) TaxID=563040 RepID=E0URK3_SULAO|nr:APC family permease [Sulfurimonas autotrophica]ADN08947.1 amino acid permease-associated region [Sulfurimonas autotrophica DSM 16294]
MKNKAFGLWSAVFLGIGSMVGAGIFVLLGEAGAIAGNLVWISFILGGIIALLSGYSLAKLASAYPSRGGIVEYLVQCYGEGVFSGSVAVLFYLSAIVAIAMVTKTFGTYASMMMTSPSTDYANIFAIGILLTFVAINLAGSTLIAKSENTIVIIKLSIIILFTVVVSFYIHPSYLSIKDAPPVLNIFSSIALTFFAYEGFRVITNTAEDMPDPSKLMMKSMTVAILLVMALYITVTFAVFGNLTLPEIIKAQDYALAEAAKPVFGQIGFTIMAIAALISTSSSINANLYAVTNVTYDMAKNGDLPEVYERNVYNSTEGLIISAVFLIFLILFFDLQEIAAIGSISMLFIHALVHIGHLLKRKHTGASTVLLLLAIVTMFIAIILALQYTSKHIPNVGYYIAIGFVLAFLIEIGLRILTKRIIKKQTF